jgi:hypothetical protein
VNVSGKDSDLEETIDKISDLASKISVNKLESESASQLNNANNLLASSHQVASYLPDILDKYNKTSEALSQEQNKTQHLDKNFNEFKDNNLKFLQNLNNVSLSSSLSQP